MPFIPKLPFPNIPRVPGVPQLPRSPFFPPSAAPVLTGAIAIGRLWQSLNMGPLWGVFDPAGKLALDPDNIMDLGLRNRSNVSNFPVQEGAFAAYNKVATPIDLVLRMTKGSTIADRRAFLDALDIVAASTLLYTIMTPERTWMGYNMEGYELVRSGAKGANFFHEVDCYFKQIRQIAPQYTSTSTSTDNAQNVAAQPPVNVGRIQPTDTIAEARATLARLQDFRRNSLGISDEQAAAIARGVPNSPGP